ncbi:MAG: pyruvate dehydrogenase (acetyl-transferring) E1 component subunit alpha [Phenylobacterium sp.]|uniref:pyruvate dehydrogenase (acetyl-transferring) E1 component subunit alpha n=1 Tax=Phenylobacterium sp. TaxID=1871053 RepID=UPI0027218E4A|nr:pyruvate dehydrogenase (acetyl-transferring) E1 component subunit alpha [Phenylobacterium sp.]MDO8911729.1 pyruvate dehydrogenase (acetyl-transferring) E1 component subunit alpha [Phenylobacterium sp.]MDO9245663.1 pyruvate dehydrogenase (acetyl-transferring) E1 component subunit alpha [Phenylobacterium sp.]MDP2009656.1 pyruvate dehydrogenase (acetyl-transferring) E1 component subunit alpha [Phenylobacterium sp.]MDP3099890.1 pyruvate dehydrogenase (acetyl-transferring) E1 component subunit al
MARGQTSSTSKRKKDDTGVIGGGADPMTKDSLLKFYRDMLLIRRFEERAGQLYGMGLIGGFCHLYIGQEAIAVGVQSIKEAGDQVITGYRDHGHMLACGMDPREVMAELTGRFTGSSKGKGGSMHMFSTEADFYGGHGIVGGQVSLGTGLALANRYKGNKKVAFTYFGDGAANQGQVYESFNMATIWKLPVVYVIENNQYAMGTSIERSSSETHLYKRGASFRIPGEEVDGMDVIAVQEAARKAAAHARSGEGPYILEMKTYRYRGHSMSDPAKYRTREEVDEVRKTRDPIDHLQELLEKKGWADEAALKAIDAEVKKIVADAAEFARTSPEPDPSELYTDVYLEAAQ